MHLPLNQKLKEILLEQGFLPDFGLEYQIPHLVVWKEEKGMMTLREALRVAYWIQDCLSCPVHFDSLNAYSVSFYIFEEKDGDVFSQDRMDDNGMPLSQWLSQVFTGLAPLPYNMGGRLDNAGVCTPSRSFVPGLIWATAPTGMLNSFKRTEKSGKWCVFCDESTVDSLWDRVRRHTLASTFVAARVSPMNEAKLHEGTYVVSVYVNDWTNVEEVMAARESLRQLGVTEEIGFKRDRDTELGVYGGKAEWTYRA